MNDQEREVLQRWLARGPCGEAHSIMKPLICSSVGLLLCIASALGLAMLGWNPVIFGLIGGIVCVVAIICIYALFAICGNAISDLRRRREFRVAVDPAIRKALERGTVDVKRFTAIAVVEIQEFEDEGTGYIFDLSNGQLLFIKGQEYLPATEQMAWPNREFEIVRSPALDTWVGVFCYGDPLDVSQVIPCERCRDDVAWASREDLVEGELPKFVESLLAE